jgi:hypothetical protein
VRAATPAAALAFSPSPFFAGQQHPPGSVERVVTASPVAGLFVVHPAANRIQRPVRQADHVEGVDHLGGLGQDHCVDRRVGGGHVQRTEGDPLLAGGRLLVQKPCHVHEMTARQDVDDLVMLHIADRRGIAGVLLSEADEAGLVQPNRGRSVQPFTVGR